LLSLHKSAITAVTLENTSAPVLHDDRACGGRHTAPRRVAGRCAMSPEGPEHQDTPSARRARALSLGGHCAARRSRSQARPAPSVPVLFCRPLRPPHLRGVSSSHARDTPVRRP
jgi:hypothetical protein